MKMMYSNVEKFINEFNKYGEQVINCFTEGNCYWFAHILHTRFPNSVIMINNVINHFACNIDGNLYDITGKCDNTYEGSWENWNEYQNLEPIKSERIIQYCVDKGE